MDKCHCGTRIVCSYCALKAIVALPKQYDIHIGIGDGQNPSRPHDMFYVWICIVGKQKLRGRVQLAYRWMDVQFG